MSEDVNYSQGTVPLHQRKSLLSLAFIMLGLTFFSASMLAGGRVGAGLDLQNFFIAIIIGNSFLAIYTAFLGYIGVKTGLTTHLLARYAFGRRGAWLPSFLLAGTQVGWFGVGVAMFVIPVSEVTGINLYLLIVIAGALMTGTMYFGIGAIAALSILAVPSMTILGVYSVWEAVTSVGGIKALAAVEPTDPLTMASALSIVIGSFISAGSLTADFLRFGKNAKTAIIVAVLAFFIGNSLMFIFGAMGTLALGKADIFDVMLIQGLIIPAIIILGLNIWTTNNNALYASGLGFSSMTGISSRKLSMILGFIGTILSLWLYNNFVDWLVFLSSAIPPIGTILIADFFMDRKRYASIAKMNDIFVNWNAVIAVAIGVIASYTFNGIVPLNSVIASLITYILLEKTLGAKNHIR